MKRPNLILWIALTSIVSLLGCEKQDGSKAVPSVEAKQVAAPSKAALQPATPATSMRIPPPPAGSGSGVTALKWAVPAGWVSEPPSNNMRKAQYKITGKEGDAQCVVYYFGPNQGGDATANATRWAGQFTLSDGRSGTEGMKTSTRKIGAIEVLTVEVVGTYSGGMMGKGPAAPNSMLLGAIAKGPDANWFFKLTGPRATVGATRAQFEGLITSLKSGS